MSDKNDEADRIRRLMQHVRQDMGQELKGIVLGARQLSDWRYYVKQHPWACLSAAFGLGFALMPGKRTPAQAQVDKLLAELRQNAKTAQLLSRGAPGGMLAKVIGLAAPIVVRSATAFISNQLAGERRPPAPDDSPHTAPSATTND
jgi:hypothetical protein